MGYVSTRKALLQSRLTSVQTRLAKLYTMLDETSESAIQSYSFDSGEGAQRVTRRKLNEIQDVIDRLEAKERSLINDLYNMGLVNISLRRKKPTCLR
jgi:hypothetical protein